MRESPSPKGVLSIPLHKLLPCEMDEVDLRSQMTVLVERILCSHILFLNEVWDKVKWHIHHQYSVESTRKTEMVNSLNFNLDIVLYEKCDYVHYQ